MKNELLIKRILIIVSVVTWLAFNILEGLTDKGYFQVDIRLGTYSCLFVFLVVTIYLFNGTGNLSLLFSEEKKLDERQLDLRYRSFYKAYWLFLFIMIIAKINVANSLMSYLVITAYLVPSWVIVWQGHKEIILEDDEDEEDFELISKIIK